MTQLTPRQRQIARLLARGHSQKQIAHRLNLSRHTVYDHTRNMRSRTGATTVGIAIKAAQMGGGEG